MYELNKSEIHILSQKLDLNRLCFILKLKYKKEEIKAKTLSMIGRKLFL